jgi:hypothetical protein
MEEEESEEEEEEEEGSEAVSGEKKRSNRKKKVAEPWEAIEIISKKRYFLKKNQQTKQGQIVSD